MTFVWGRYTTGRLEPVSQNYDAPANEIVEVREAYGVPAGIPGITESLIFNNIRSGVESNGGTLTFCQIEIDWFAFQTRIVYQYKSPGLLVGLIVLAVLALLVILGLWLLLQELYRIAGPTGVTLGLLAIVIFGAIILGSLVVLPLLTKAKKLIASS